MSGEPYYTDDPFGDDGEPSWLRAESITGEAYKLLIKAMDTCRRTSHTFKDQAEQRKWKKIASKLEKGIMRAEWVQNCIQFAHEKNEDSRYALAMSFANLTKYILNMAKMTDWQAKNPTAGGKVVIKIDTSKGY